MGVVAVREVKGRLVAQRSVDLVRRGRVVKREDVRLHRFDHRGRWLSDRVQDRLATDNDELVVSRDIGVSRHNMHELL